MKKYFIITIFIFLINCASEGSKVGVKNLNAVQNDIDISKEYSFEEYVELLLNKNKSKKYPDINKIPD